MWQVFNQIPGDPAMTFHPFSPVNLNAHEPLDEIQEPGAKYGFVRMPCPMLSPTERVCRPDRINDIEKNGWERCTRSLRQAARTARTRHATRRRPEAECSARAVQQR